MIGVFTIDPGKHSGVCYSVLDEEAKSVYWAFQHADKLTSLTIEGTPISQARQIFHLWRRFRTFCLVDGIPVDRIYMVIEDFQVSPTTPPGEQILWALKVTWTLIGYRHGGADEWDRHTAIPLAPVEIEWQSPSAAKSYATDERLKRWGLWVPGKDHERDARRHMATFLNGQIR